jgi:4,5-dihydroxyphthalate decarboxylase
MGNLNLSFAMTPYDRILPLIGGEVKPDGINLEYTGMPGGVPRVFYEQMKFQRYDLSEMSLSSYLRMRSIRWPYYILPVFHNRNFSYSHIRIRKNSGIRPGHPEDLKGKRIGIEITSSPGLWTRGILEMEWGLKPEDMMWYQERGQHFSHTGAAREAGLNIPPQVTLNFAEKDFGAMYRDGELDANCGLGPGTGLEHGLLDRRRDDVSVNEVVVPLFPDSKQEAIRFFRKTGIYPPHHTTIIRESIVQVHPWVVISLMEAFEKRKGSPYSGFGSLPRDSWFSARIISGKWKKFSVRTRLFTVSNPIQRHSIRRKSSLCSRALRNISSPGTRYSPGK